MEFLKWVDHHGGMQKLSVDLNVTRGCVEAWCVRRAAPKAVKIFQLVQLSRGKLSYRDVLYGTLPKKTLRSRIRRVQR